MDGRPVTGVVGSEEVLARLALLKLPRVGTATLEVLLETFGSGRSALAAPGPAFDRVTTPGTARARDNGACLREAEAVLSRCREVGGWVMARGDPRYPSRLEHLSSPPPLLFGRGEPELLDARTVTVVGTRRATTYGRRVAERLGRGLSEAGITVASGLALGVDGAAHGGALEGPGGTVAVLGCGVDQPYPQSNRRLFQDIGRKGLLLSEFPPGTRPAPHHFPQRNRILAALGSATVVVEAGARSGALITAEVASGLGRAVFGVPGPVDRRSSEGTNELLRAGFAPALSVGDIIEPLGWGDLAWTSADTAEEGLEGDGSRLWEALGEGPTHVDELCQRSGLPPGRFLAVLTTLEVEGRIRALPGRRYERASRGAPLG